MLLVEERLELQIRPIVLNKGLSVFNQSIDLYLKSGDLFTVMTIAFLVLFSIL